MPFLQSNPADLPGNQSKLQNIQQLKEKWVCNKGTDSCVGNACYVDPDGKHMALSHEMLDCWALAMLQGEAVATLQSPPNHHLFPGKGASHPSILKHHLEAKQAVKVNNPLSTINLSFPPNFVGPNGAPDPLHTDTASTSFLPPYRDAGPDMNITTFYETYNLGPSVLNKLMHHAFKEVQHLQYISKAELCKMEFSFGEVAAICDAMFL
ncbi:hypothetical protein BDN71DRAFT_1511303 [Pleurotus eryngii]|uniref:Uncharacterized protein n=1 Tax=Pleurotus eryngii TaxID=5323 RepID=A0A9P5ZPM7_PLEER|nr:hypothetical protein BDN71DRAFT_1511303 [Pleurotus eryngii]